MTKVMKPADLAGVCILDIRLCPTGNISHQHLFHSRHHHYVCVGVGHGEDGLHEEHCIGHSKCQTQSVREICPLWLMYTYNTYWRSNILVPVWESITSDPCPDWGNSLLASSQPESTGRSPELLHQSLDILSRYQTRWASDELPHGWGPHESLLTPFFLHAHPAEPVTRRTVQSSGADSAQSALIYSRSSSFTYYRH